MAEQVGDGKINTMASHLLQQVLSDLTGDTALRRERGVLALNRFLNGSACNEHVRDRLQGEMVQLLASENWTYRLAALNIAKALLKVEGVQDTATSSAGQEKEREQALQGCLLLLEDSEPRVREAAGDCLGLLAQKEGPRVWESAREPILTSIERYWDRDTEASTAEQESAGSSRAGGKSDNAGGFVSNLLGTSYSFQAPGTGDMRHGTEGWGCLETSYKALRQIMEGCGERFRPHATPELRALLFRGLLHPNRFVRETGYHITATLCTLCAGADLEAFARDAVERLQDGLSENWSQVRYAACVAARAFMLSLGDARTAFYPDLLPHLCFNRHDVAEGVASYSRDTWRLVMGSEGRDWVAKCMPQVIEYYTRCSRTNNHTVREAACTCIAELASKIDPDAVRPHVPAMLRTLITCLRDDSWPVRDRALLAAGSCALAFPAECAPSLPDLYRLWMAHLDDNIYSVREDAAVALGDVVRAYKQEALDKLLPWLREALPKAKDQPPDAADDSGHTLNSPQGAARAASTPAAASGPQTGEKGGTSPKGTMALSTGITVVAGGVRRISAEVAQPEEGGLFHGGPLTNRKKDTGGVDYSCGCMDYGFKRPKEKWEASDGAVYLLRELAQVAPETVPEFLPTLAEVASLTHFSHCRNLQETIWKQLPTIAAGLGKRVFKRHMDALLEPLFASLACEHQLCRAAAGKCIGQLRDFVGPGIWAGHLTEDQAAAMARSPDIPAPAGVFSKLGGSGAARSPTLAVETGLAPTMAPWAWNRIPLLQRPAVKPGYGMQYPGNDQ